MNIKLPHVVLLILSAVALFLPWLSKEASAGAITLPAWYPGAANLLTVVLAALGVGTDSAFGKNGGGGPKVPPLAMLAIRSLAALGVVLLFAVGLSACLASAPIVAVTPSNSAQISVCQSTASLHDGIVVGDFVVGGASAGLAGVAAVVTDTNTKTTMGAVAAGVAAVGVVGAALAELTASNFTNSNCGSVVGALPAAHAPADAGAE
jgi:hypothetical protein